MQIHYCSFFIDVKIINGWMLDETSNGLSGFIVNDTD